MKKQASKNQNKAADKIEEMSQSLQSALQQAQSDAAAEDMQTLRQILENLIRLSLDQENILKIKQTVKFIFEILGFELNNSKQNIVEEKLLSKFFAKYNIQFNDIESAMSEFSLKREELRSNKKYGEADKMREDLLEIGIVINDGENVGWYWKNS